MNYIPELLSPAGTFENAKTAIMYGADAIYQGLEGFSLRKGKKAEINLSELEKCLAFTKASQKKYYLALNIFAGNAEIEALEKVIEQLKPLAIDAYIVSDPGIIQVMKKKHPLARLHLSTQSNTLNYASVAFWAEQGFERIILARELDREAIKIIKAKNPQIQLEMFVHGAMCMAYSGRCNLSLYLNKRDANKGECVHACRWKYSLLDPGSNPAPPFLEVEEDPEGMYIFNSNDLNLAPFIPELIKMNLNSFKIEGRNKTSYYIANVTRIYRAIIDSCLQDNNFVVPASLISELDKVSHRDYCSGFYESNPESNIYSAKYNKNYKMVGIISSVTANSLVINVRDEIKCGDALEIILPDYTKDISFTINSMLDTKKNIELNSAHNGYQIQTPFIAGDKALVDLIIRKRIEV